MVNDLKTLGIIDREISRLEQKQNATGLELNDIRSLETLIRTRQLLLGEPTDILKDISEDVSDSDILSILSKDFNDKTKQEGRN